MSKLPCGCPKPDQFAMCIRQEHLQLSKQTTTDFREEAYEYAKAHISEPSQMIGFVTGIEYALSAVSELVEECLGKPQEPVVEKLGENPSLAEYGAFINHIRNIKTEQIRQRLKERGITIK